MINYNILKTFYKLIRTQGIKKAIEALEQQIPQLPYNHHKISDGSIMARCSICDQEIFFPESYCVCCGYAIDWTDWKTKSEENMIITGGSVYCKNCGYQYKWEGSYPISPYCPKCNKKINWNDYDLPREEKQMKFDCYKTLDFIHEFARFCDSKSDCKDCTLFNGKCPDFNSTTQEDINIIQEWSNTHPQKTRLQAFQEIFPKFDNFVPDGTICFFHLIGQPGLYCKDAPMTESYCKECWNLPYNDEFEKLRKEKEE